MFEFLIRKYHVWKTRRHDQKLAIKFKIWREQTVNLRADSIQSMFKNFKFLIQVDSAKFFNHASPHPGWHTVDSFIQYEYPNRGLGDNAVWIFERGVWDFWNKEFHINTLGNMDLVFVATNNERDAILITLKYS
jgi:hypothetical protein